MTTDWHEAAYMMKQDVFSSPSWRNSTVTQFDESAFSRRDFLLRAGSVGCALSVTGSPFGHALMAAPVAGALPGKDLYESVRATARAQQSALRWSRYACEYRA